MKILLTDATDISAEWPRSAKVVRFSEDEPIPAEHLDADIVIAWGKPASLRSLSSMTNLRLVQSLSAGTDAFIAAGLPKGTLLTSGRGLHDRTVSEHAAALLLALVRELPEYYQAQETHEWLAEKRIPKPLYNSRRVSTLLDARTLIWGFGSIGQHLASVLTALGSSVRGVATTAGTRSGFDVISVDDIEQALPETDVLVLVLPATKSTQNALNAHRLALLPKRAIVCNVGRGSTIDEVALVAALNGGTLAGAALDVMQEEPLPSDSPLWDAPNCILTPHVAGYRADGADQLVSFNLRALAAGEELRNQVDL